MIWSSGDLVIDCMIDWEIGSHQTPNHPIRLPNPITKSPDQQITQFLERYIVIGQRFLIEVLAEVRSDELRAMARRIMRLPVVEEIERELKTVLGRLSVIRE